MINNHPLVSIIACCYNHEKFVEETLDGIISQTYENIELISKKIRHVLNS